MYKEGERIAAYPETTDAKALYFVLWTGRQPGCLRPGEVASDVTFPKRGQDLCAKSSLHGGEAGSESDPGLLLASLLPSSQVCQPAASKACSSRTPWLSTGHGVKTQN